MAQTEINVGIILLGVGLTLLTWFGVSTLIRRRIVRMTEKGRESAIYRDGIIRLYISAGSAVTLVLFLVSNWLVA